MSSRKKSGVPGRQTPALVFRNVSQATVRGARVPEGTKVFLKVLGERNLGIRLEDNDLRHEATVYQLDEGATTNTVTVIDGRPSEGIR